MRNNVRLQLLIGKYLDRSLSGTEKDELLGYFDDPAFFSEIGERFALEYERELGESSMNELHQQHLLQRVFQYETRRQTVPIRKVKLWPRIGIAAAIAMLIVFGGLWFYRANQNDNTNQIAYTSDVAPGKQSATLTLANGKKIRLTDATNGELAKESGVTISKTADGQLVYEIKGNSTERNKINTLVNTLATANGETYRVRLPDGSSVWLNAASSLKYPATFANLKERWVELSGEGYFEIAKDKAHPFIVKTDKQEVRVLGTHFNINAYADEKAITTTLLEGSVKLTEGNKSQLLRPGEQAINAEETIKVKQVNIDAVIDWKNEEFYLDKMDFRVAMRKIARWYNLDVIYNGSVPENLEAGGWIPRSSKLSDVIKSIESTGQVHFKIEGRRLYVSK
ncbi:FecR family protein [Solitalea koreensis]|uniref:FecR family protein n=1 Tax=Solitalea koreensis TaxID=543615 RepID=A0A521DKN3_9SPHI|nr:FecR family protein [Solitalea koreensis]SMO72269.1 FecR family protein [Solitalea koreensis]